MGRDLTMAQAATIMAAILRNNGARLTSGLASLISTCGNKRRADRGLTPHGSHRGPSQIPGYAPGAAPSP